MSKTFLLNGLELWRANSKENDDTIERVMSEYVAEQYTNVITQPSKMTALKKYIRKEMYDPKAPPARLTRLGMVKKVKRDGSPFITGGITIYDEWKNTDELKAKIIEYVTTWYDNRGTQISSLPRLKHAIMRHDPEAKLNDIVLPRKIYDEEAQNKLIKVTQKGQTCTEINDTDALFSKVLAGITSNDQSKLYPALLLATGRRLNEINETGAFTETGDDYTAVFNGQLKTANPQPYEIPLMLPTAVVSNALIRLRMILRSYPQYATSHAVSNYIQAITGLNISAHNLRSIYAVAMYNTRPEHFKLYNKSTFISAVLGHANASTVQYYDCYKLHGLTTTTYYADVPQLVYNASNRAEVNLIVNINKLLAEKKKITNNALRKLGSSPAIIKRVFDKNPQLRV
jgi:integrase